MKSLKQPLRYSYVKQGSSQKILQEQQRSSFYQYNPYKNPPNTALCLKHYQCNRFGKDNNDINDKCPCCSQKYKIPLKLNCPIKQVQQISTPIAFYFELIKIMLLFCLIMFIINGIYSQVQIITYCKEKSDNCIHIKGLPFKKLQSFFNFSHDIIDLITILFMYGFIFYITYVYIYMYKTELSKVKASNYTILLGGINYKQITVQDIKQFFKMQGVDIDEIVITHKIGQYIKAERLVFVYQSKLQYYRYKVFSKQKIEYFTQKISEMNAIMYPIRNKFYFNQQQDIRADKIFISFQSSIIKDLIEKKFQEKKFLRIFRNLLGKSDLQINGVSLYLEELPEPNQIIWTNLEVPSTERYFRVLISNLSTVVLLIISFFLIVLLYQQQKLASHNYYAYLCAMTITIINFLLSYTINYFVKKQKRYINTGVRTAILTKQSICMFINTTLIPFSMFFLFNLKETNEVTIISNTIVIFIFNALINPIMFLLNFLSFYRFIKRRQILNDQLCFYMQKQANQFFEKVDFEIEFKYALIIKIIFMATFYGSIFPLGWIIISLGLILSYYSSKYMLIKHTCITKISYKMSKRVNDLLCFLPFIYQLGVVTNSYLITQNKNSTFKYILLLLSIVLSLLSFFYNERIIKRFVLKMTNHSYEPKISRRQALSQGLIDYKNLNPTSVQEKIHKQLNFSVLQDQNPYISTLNLYAYEIIDQDSFNQ